MSGVCDWRLSLSSCLAEGAISSAFFKRVFLSGFIITLISTLVVAFTIVFRLKVMGQPAKSFKSGMNLSLAFLFVNYSCSFIYFLYGLYGTNVYTSEFLWVLLFCSFLLPELNHLNMMMESLGILDSSFELPVFFNSKKKRQALFATLFFLELAAALPVMLLSHHYALSDPALSRGLQTGGHCLLAAVFILINLLNLRYFAVFRSATISRMSNIKEHEVMFDDTMVITIRKIKNTFIVVIISNTILSLVALTLAFYPAFFSNVTLSRGYAVLFLVDLCQAFPLALNILFVDIKKKNTVSHHSSHHSSKPGSKGSQL